MLNEFESFFADIRESLIIWFEAVCWKIEFFKPAECFRKGFGFDEDALAPKAGKFLGLEKGEKWVIIEEWFGLELNAVQLGVGKVERIWGGVLLFWEK